MVPAVLILLAAAPIESQIAPRQVIASGIQVRAVASAEIIRVGRAGGEGGPEDILAPVRIGRDGRAIAEFR